VSLLLVPIRLILCVEKIACLGASC
jgi:hypothetical protein